jgi:hypothetical protein
MDFYPDRSCRDRVYSWSNNPLCSDDAMPRIFIGLIAMIAWFWSTSFASAGGFKDGNKLLYECNSTAEISVLTCFGYIEAIADVLGAGNGVNGYHACLRGGVQADQLRDIVRALGAHLGLTPPPLGARVRAGAARVSQGQPVPRAL